MYLLTYLLNCHFSRWTWVSQSPTSPPPPTIPEENLWGLVVKKEKFSHTRYWALGPELIPVYRQSARRWPEAIHPAVDCHYFLPGPRLPSQPKSVTAHRPVSNYTAWWQRHMRVSSLPKAVTWKQTGQDSNRRPFGSRANALLLSHTRWCSTWMLGD